jgi:hypothetical protein
MALATGYRTLVILCAALYLGAFLLTPRGTAGELTPAARTPQLADSA